MIDKIEYNLLQEIERSKSENCIEYDDSEKWKPMVCKLCRENFTRKGIDRHLRYAHDIERFDYGVREYRLEQHRETKEWIKQIVTSMVAKSVGMKISSTLLLEKLDANSVKDEVKKDE